MQIIDSPRDFRNLCEQTRSGGLRIGFVPTMGALHSGHLSLIELASQHADVVFVSIFVNPTQFGPEEDLAKYPRDLAADVAKCEAQGAQAVFSPQPAAMYPPGEQTRVVTGSLSEALCGHSRPGHFDGVCTVVSKLLNLTGPCTAVFGRKDYQQFKIVERLVRDLLLPVQLLDHPIVREPDGLALSSRNRYLSEVERRSAVAVSAALNAAHRSFERGERNAVELEQQSDAIMRERGLETDYARVVDAETLRPPADGQILGSRALLALAAFAGKTRLIDNLVLGEDPEILRA